MSKLGYYCLYIYTNTFSQSNGYTSLRRTIICSLYFIGPTLPFDSPDSFFIHRLDRTFTFVCMASVKHLLGENNIYHSMLRLFHRQCSNIHLHPHPILPLSTLPTYRIQLKIPGTTTQSIYISHFKPPHFQRCHHPYQRNSNQLQRT